MFILKITAYALLIIIIITLFLSLIQSKLVFHPSQHIETTPIEIGLQFEDLYIKTSDSIQINAWYIPAEKKDKVILFCHGNAGNISHRLFSIKQFHDLGYGVLIFDYRGYGASEGKISEIGTYKDATAAYDFLLSKGFADKDIILFGRSLGGAVAAEIAKSRSPAGLILESTFTSIPDMGAKLYPLLPVRLFCYIKYNTISKIKEIKCPLLVIHSPDDEIVPFDMGMKIFEQANEPKKFFKIHGSHNEGYFISSPQYENTLRDFIQGLN